MRRNVVSFRPYLFTLETFSKGSIRPIQLLVMRMHNRDTGVPRVPQIKRNPDVTFTGVVTHPNTGRARHCLTAVHVHRHETVQPQKLTNGRLYS